MNSLGRFTKQTNVGEAILEQLIAAITIKALCKNGAFLEHRSAKRFN